jgi:hypothetical protein
VSKWELHGGVVFGAYNTGPQAKDARLHNTQDTMGCVRSGDRSLLESDGTAVLETDVARNMKIETITLSPFVKRETVSSNST